MSIKRFIILLIIIPLLLLTGAVIYYFFIQAPERPPDESEKVEKPKVLVSEPVISPILSFNQERVWFLTLEGRLFRKFLEGGEAEEYPLPRPIKNPQAIIWPKTGNDFLVEQEIEGRKYYLFFDSVARGLITYPVSIQNPRFLPEGNKIVCDWVTATGERELKVADPNIQNFLKVTDLYRGDYLFEVSPVRQEIALFTSDRISPTKLFLIDLITGKFTDVTSLPVSLEGVKFSPDGTKLLAAKFSNTSGDQPNLVLFDLETLKEQDLGISAKIEQTVWAEESQEIVIAQGKEFLKYELADKKTTPFYQLAPEFEVIPQDLILVPGKLLLLFVDEKSGNLYRLDL